MSKTNLSLAINIGVTVAALVGAAIFSLINGNAITMIVGVLVVGSAAWGIVRVFRRPGDASDVDRLNAMRYLDERDRSLATQAFSIVGIVALLLTLGTVLVTAIFTGLDPLFIAWVQFVVVFGAWAIANAVVVRKRS